MWGYMEMSLARLYNLVIHVKGRRGSEAGKGWKERRIAGGVLFRVKQVSELKLVSSVVCTILFTILVDQFYVSL